MRKNHSQQRSSALTRVELLISLACVGLLLAIALPVLANSHADSQAASCRNNLRQIGRAVAAWGGDHGDRVPWWTPLNDGGTLPLSGVKPGNAWFEWVTFTNEMPNPTILACPADTGTKVAPTFQDFTSANYRSAALSYMIGLHTVFDDPNIIVTGDRNLRFDGFGVSCPTRVNNAEVLFPTQSTARWTNAVHGTWGHVLLIDGSVSATSTSDLLNLLFNSSDNGSQHLLRAR